MGLNATIPELASALVPLKEGRWGIRISADMLDAIIRDTQHQAVINSILTDGFKRNGYDTTYKDIYPDYVKTCETLGLKPFALKTFQNRALQRQARWERNLNKTASKVS